MTAQVSIVWHNQWRIIETWCLLFLNFLGEYSHLDYVCPINTIKLIEGLDMFY
jgi:hypothetical protein